MSLKIVRQDKQYSVVENRDSFVMYKYILRIRILSCMLNNFKNDLSNKVKVYFLLASKKKVIFKEIYWFSSQALAQNKTKTLFPSRLFWLMISSKRKHFIHLTCLSHFSLYLPFNMILWIQCIFTPSTNPTVLTADE